MSLLSPSTGPPLCLLNLQRLCEGETRAFRSSWLQPLWLATMDQDSVLAQLSQGLFTWLCVKSGCCPGLSTVKSPSVTGHFKVVAPKQCPIAIFIACIHRIDVSLVRLTYCPPALIFQCQNFDSYKIESGKKVTINSNKVNGASHLPSGWRYHNCGFLCPH